MDNVINQLIGYGVLMSPIVMILVETIKKPKIIPSKWIAWVSLGIGILFGIGLSLAHPEIGSIADMGLAGLVAGGVASGVYNQVTKPAAKS